MSNSKLRLTFAPGCFDEIGDDVTQEELDEIIAYITKAVSDGSILDIMEPVPDEEAQAILDQIESKGNTRQ
jgi:flagellar motility protein MotE (MotC chaperone)